MFLCSDLLYSTYSRVLIAEGSVTEEMYLGIPVDLSTKMSSQASFNIELEENAGGVKLTKAK